MARTRTRFLFFFFGWSACNWQEKHPFNADENKKKNNEEIILNCKTFHISTRQNGKYTTHHNTSKSIYYREYVFSCLFYFTCCCCRLLCDVCFIFVSMCQSGRHHLFSFTFCILWYQFILFVCTGYIVAIVTNENCNHFAYWLHMESFVHTVYTITICNWNMECGWNWKKKTNKQTYITIILVIINVERNSIVRWSKWGECR